MPKKAAVYSVKIATGEDRTVKSRHLTIDSKYSRKVFFESPIDDTDATTELIIMKIYANSTYDDMLGKPFEGELERFVMNRGFLAVQDSSTVKTFRWRLGQRSGLLAIGMAFRHYENFVRQFLENNEK